MENTTTPMENTTTPDDNDTKQNKTPTNKKYDKQHGTIFSNDSDHACVICAFCCLDATLIGIIVGAALIACL